MNQVDASCSRCSKPFRWSGHSPILCPECRDQVNKILGVDSPGTDPDDGLDEIRDFVNSIDWSGFE